MNLLPKSHKDFSDKDYWNSFFKKRGNKAFEWYGEYVELCVQLHKYIKRKDAVLIPGCGNSSLSAELYDVGFENITNIDLSEVVIKQMTKINAKRTKMKFLYMDAMNTTFEDESFNVVLDKGTLDALMTDNTDETNARVDKYFSEIKRLLKFGGRYVCISLLQSHILRKFLDSFSDKSWMLRTVRCHEAEGKNAENGDGMTLPVFVVVATKFKELPELLLEICMAGEKMQRLASGQEMEDQVRSAQDTAFVTNGLSRTSLDDEEVSLDLVEPGQENPRYTLYIVDQPGHTAANKYAVFIVPQGRDSEWLFGTPEGRKQLLESARFSRLVIVTLRRGHTFDTLDSVKEEVTHCARTLVPSGFTGKIPFLSLANDVGHRTEVARGHSDMSGSYVIEDVEVDGLTFRRLVFLDNQFLVQSEARLKVKKKKTVVDFGRVSSYQSFMCVCLCLAHTQKAACAGAEPLRSVVLGLGGGSLCMFIRKCWPDVKLTAVDIDPAMLEVGRKYFDLQTDENFEVQIRDGLDFLKNETTKGSKFDTIMLDIDSKDRSLGLSCPPKEFLDDDVLDDITTLLGETGHFILNMVCRDPILQAGFIITLKNHFKNVVSISLFEQVNNIIYANNGDPYVVEELEAASKSVNASARLKNLVDTKCVDLKEFMQSVKLLS